MSRPPVKIAILFSGRGSNLKSLATHIRRQNIPGQNIPAELVLAITNRPDAKGIEFCRTQAIPYQIIDHKKFASRDAFDAALHTALQQADIELICCAGFMRLLTSDFVAKWHDRLINIHPSLLPKHRGLNTHARALQAGDTEHGCTVHYMRAEMDNGPIIVQKKVPVLQGDTPATLAARVLEQEHIAYPEALDVVLGALNKPIKCL